MTGRTRGKALALGEEAADGVADGVLRLDRGSAAWDVAEGALEVLRGGDGGGVVLEVEVKVAKEPDEGWGKTSELGGISRRAAPSLAPGLDADVLGHLCHQGEAIERRLVDAAHLVVHEERREEHRHAEDLGAVLPRLVVRVDALGVEENQVVGVALGVRQGWARTKSKVPSCTDEPWGRP